MSTNHALWLLIASLVVISGELAAQADPVDGEPAAAVEETEDDSEARTVDLIFRGGEAKPRTLDVGGGWNGSDGVYARVAFRDRNFLGRGELFGAVVDVGERRQSYELEYRKPWLFDRPQWLGVRLFDTTSEDAVAADTDFESRRTGGAVSFGRRLGGLHLLRLELRAADIEEGETVLGAGGELITRQSSYFSSSIWSRWTYDTLDSRLAPFRGLRLDGSLELAGVLGGDAEYVKPTFGLTWLRPTSGLPLRSTLAVRTRLGWIGELGGRELFPQQRFFPGGERSVRGFRRRSISVLAEDGTRALDADGFPIGGERLAQLNLEYHMLLGKRFRLVLFADAGGVFESGRGFDVDGLRTSAGAELWVHVPKLGVPLRLIYAENLDPLPTDRFDELSFSFGITF